MYKISIAIATYNGQKYIEQQLQSIINQNVVPDEVVICDDKSTDNTFNIVESFSKRAPFKVSYYQNEIKLGYAGNFNKAISLTSGDLVFLCDQDDYWFPNKIEKIVQIAESYPESLVIMNDAALTDHELNTTGLTKLGQIRSSGFSDRNFVMGCCVAVRRELLDICLPIPFEFTAHDNWIVLIAYELNRRKLVTDVLQYYRRHDVNTSTYIINRLTRVDKIDILIDNLKKVYRQLFIDRLNKISVVQNQIPFYELILNWINSYDKEISISVRRDIAKLKYRLQKYDVAYKTREQIKLTPLPRRFKDVIKFMRSGGYSHFSGKKSALKDLILPKIKLN